MVDYPHQNIWINGRQVFIKDIVEGRAKNHTNFESSTFSFIREWIAGQEHYVIETSGSTGTPKQISIYRDEMIASAKLSERALGLHPSYNALVCLDARYMAGKMMLVRSFTTGMKIFVTDPCANPLARIPVDHTIQFAALVPYQIQAIVESKHPHLLDALMTCIVGGAPLHSNLKERLQRFSTRIYETYGMTETISHVALQPVNGHLRSDLFFTLPGVEAQCDERGCLVIHASHLRNREFITNDLVELINNREFKWLGRWDNVINSGGVKVSPEKIEERIGQIFTRLKITNRFFIYGQEDQRLGQRVILVIEGALPNHNVMKQLKEAFVLSFTSFEKPKQILAVSEFIQTSTSKINRHETFRSAKGNPSVDL
jgi:o-succinylbenzoate---CoA ligase